VKEKNTFPQNTGNTVLPVCRTVGLPNSPMPQNAQHFEGVSYHTLVVQEKNKIQSMLSTERYHIHHIVNSKPSHDGYHL
jgi:hypothetical protein